MLGFFSRFLAPTERQLPDLRNISYYIVRLFFPAHGHLRLELTMVETDGVHPQFPAGTDFTRWTVADNEYFCGLQSGLSLDLAEGRYLGELVAEIGKINLFDRRLAVQAERLHL